MIHYKMYHNNDQFISRKLIERKSSKSIKYKVKSIRATPIWSPKFSPSFKKVKVRLAKTPEIEAIQERVSFEPLYNSIIFNALINNPNICIYPKDITVMVQGNISYINELELNKAVTAEDYYKFADKYFFDKTRRDFDNIHMRNFLAALNHDNKKFLKECDKKVIIFPVELVGYNISKEKPVKKIFWHATQLIVDLAKKKAYYIDSQDNVKENFKNDKYIYDRKKMYKFICYKLEVWIQNILGQKIKVKMLDLEAPQSITRDENCIFWSFLLADTIIRYYGEAGILDPKTVIKNIKKKYNTRRRLKILIRKYISYVKKKQEDLGLFNFEALQIKEKKVLSLWEKIKNFFKF